TVGPVGRSWRPHDAAHLSRVQTQVRPLAHAHPGMLAAPQVSIITVVGGWKDLIVLCPYTGLLASASLLLLLLLFGCLRCWHPRDAPPPCPASQPRCAHTPLQGRHQACVQHRRGLSLMLMAGGWKNLAGAVPRAACGKARDGTEQGSRCTSESEDCERHEGRREIREELGDSEVWLSSCGGGRLGTEESGVQSPHSVDAELAVRCKHASTALSEQQTARSVTREGMPLSRCGARHLLLQPQNRIAWSAGRRALPRTIAMSSYLAPASENSRSKLTHVIITGNVTCLVSVMMAWKRRWFVLRSGRLTGDPDVLEYYKNNHAKKPIRIIDLNLCQQVDAGLTFNKKEFENSYIFDINTIDRIFYLVADSEEEMNKWVRCICDICGFNPTEEDPVKPPGSSLQAPADLPLPVNTAPPSTQVESSSGVLPPPYQLISSPPHLETLGLQEDPQDYLLLINCQSKMPEPARTHVDSAKPTSSETDCNDNVAAHKNPASAQSKHGVNGFFQHQPAYDSPAARSASTPADASLYSLPRSYSHDVLPKASPSSADADGELYVFSTPSGTACADAQPRHVPVSYDIPPTPGNTYQIPRTFPEGTFGQTAKLDPIPDIPPPRPPKPPPAHDRSPVETCGIARTASDTDGSSCVPKAGMPPARSNTISTVDLNKLRKDREQVIPDYSKSLAKMGRHVNSLFSVLDASSQDCYDIPRTFPSDRSSSLEGFHNHFKIKNVLTVGSVSSEELDENYVPMNPNSPPRQHSSSFTEPIQEANYVPMTPGTFDFSSFGMQVPPPAHMGFRSSPKTPPRRPVPVVDCEPPPVDRNLKPDRKVKPAPLEIKPFSEWEELQAPIRSPITRSFARESSVRSRLCCKGSFSISSSRFPLSPRPDSVHSTTSSSDSHDSEENYVPMNPNLSSEDSNLFGSNSLDGGSSPVIKPKGDKQVEYLDLDLDSGKSTPPRKQKSSGSGSSVADERVDYVVVDQQKTLALKSTREAWTDGRQCESETPAKTAK
ncbi:GRB2-associated-binding protein 1, partial [Galemys pyrenaicus]